MASVMIHGNNRTVTTDVRQSINGLMYISIEAVSPATMDGEKLIGGDVDSITLFLTPEQVALIVGSLTVKMLISKVKEQADA